jgi:O-antigen/teichoic acid export membrane protein
MKKTILRLLKGSFAFGLASIVQRVISFILLPIYTHYLSPNEYGILTVIISVLAFTKIFLMWGQPGAITRTIKDYDSKKEKNSLISSVTIFLSLSNIILIFVLILFGEKIFNFLLPEIQFSPYINITLISAYFFVIQEILLAVFRANEDIKNYLYIQLGRSILSFFLIILVLTVFDLGVLGQIKADFISNLLVFTFCLILSIKLFGISFNIKSVKKSLKFGLPLVPHLLFGWFLSQGDRLILSNFTTNAMIGIYDLGYRVSLLISFVTISINFSWVPIFYDTAKNNNKAKNIFSKIFPIYLCIIAILTIVTYLLSPYLVSIIAPFNEYKEAVPIARVVAIASFIQGLYYIFVTPVFYKKRTNLLPLISGTTCVGYFFLNLILINKYGILGAAYSTLVASAFFTVATYIVSQKLYYISYKINDIFKILGIAIFIFFLDFLIYTKLFSYKDLLLKIFLVFLAILLLLFFKVINSEEVKNFIKLMRSSLKNKSHK